MRNLPSQCTDNTMRLAVLVTALAALACVVGAAPAQVRRTRSVLSRPHRVLSVGLQAATPSPTAPSSDETADDSTADESTVDESTDSAGGYVAVAGPEQSSSYDDPNERGACCYDPLACGGGASLCKELTREECVNPVAGEGGCHSNRDLAGIFTGGDVNCAHSGTHRACPAGPFPAAPLGTCCLYASCHATETDPVSTRCVANTTELDCVVHGLPCYGGVGAYDSLHVANGSHVVGKWTAGAVCVCAPPPYADYTPNGADRGLVPAFLLATAAAAVLLAAAF
jgi:hypothetical protein